LPLASHVGQGHYLTFTATTTPHSSSMAYI
jgi:hypothetical protein